MADSNLTVPEVNVIYPSITDYYTDLKPFTILTISAGGLFFLINKIIFLQTLCKIFKRIRTSYRWHTLALCSIYPVVALMAFMAILIPQAGLLCNSIMHISFTISCFIFYKLFFKYVGGEKNYLEKADADVFNVRTPPCCCCCFCLKPISATIERISFVRYMILQLPIVQTALVLAINVIYFADFNIYQNVSYYFIPFMVSSILIGLWGLNILVRLIQPQAKNHNLMLKYLSLQLVLVFCKLQPAILEGLFHLVVFPNQYPLTEHVYKQSIIQVAILGEMILLSLLAQKAYDKPQHL